ncbi:MAG: iron chelate uptake ABC transporter family permease subunit [Actinomycetaceae bacterium]|nr:iron chelate uptake ABC transporter family permease subunit [Actinomycetaceae bacterium]
MSAATISLGADINIGAVIAARAKDARTRTLLLGALAVLAAAFFLLWDAAGAWQIIAAFRLKRLAALIVVAVALSAATVIFQAVARNRILTPSVMGFDAMYALVATASVFFLTAHTVNMIPASIMFLLQSALMALLATTMFMTVLKRRSVHLLVLVGVVVGTLLRSITNMMSIVMDPNEYLAAQDLSTASFATVNTSALWITVATSIGAIGYAMWRANIWDVLAMGPSIATGLGVNYNREVKAALAVSAILVSAATALAGPLMFFGLLIANIAVAALGSASIRYLLPAASAIGVIVLVGGQGILEHVLGGETILPIVIEFVGGALLLAMLVREARR